MAFKPTEEELYRNKLQDKAEIECKSKEEWLDQEAEKIQGKECEASISQVSIEELIEHYSGKLYRLQMTELKLCEKLTSCEKRIEDLEIEKESTEEISKNKKKLISLNNKLEAAKKWKVELIHKLKRQELRIKHFNEKIMKWLGINEKIKISEVSKEIWLEKHNMLAPKYGYGNNREETSYWYTEKGFLYDENLKYNGGKDEK